MAIVVNFCQVSELESWCCVKPSQPWHLGIWQVLMYLNNLSQVWDVLICFLYKFVVVLNNLVIINTRVNEVNIYLWIISSVHFSRSVVSDSLQPREPQHARPPCPSPTPGIHPNPCPWSRWCHLTISSSVIPFSSCPQSLPASGSFPMSQLFHEVAKVLKF